jgi:transposase-like protein
MGQILHKRAKTTHAIRAEIQRSEATILELSQKYNLNPNTVLKWKHRKSVEDAPMGPKRFRTVLSLQDEEMICAFRRKTLLPLDDCYIALKDHIPSLSRSNLHRCLQRNKLNKLLKEKTGPEKKPFKKYEIGYFHIDICEIRTGEGKVYLYVAVDRTCKYVYAEVHPAPTSHVASLFLKNLIFVVPYKIHKILTDNGLQFSLKLMKRGRAYQSHAFEQVCQEYGIEHRLTQFKHPWTNGQVERMNRTLKEATVKTYHYDTLDQFKEHLYHFLNAYNYAKKLKTLKFLTPCEKILKEYQDKPTLFHSNPNYYLMGLNT